MSVMIKQTSVDELMAESNFQELLDRYADEKKFDGLPHPKANMPMYRKIEALGKIHFFAAYLGNLLIGIINVLITENPHYDCGIEIAMIESWFVLKEYRNTGAGNFLKKIAKIDAKKSGVPGIIYSASVGSDLEKVLENSNECRVMTKTFFESLT